jgi:hypothetical protein
MTLSSSHSFKPATLGRLVALAGFALLVTLLLLPAAQAADGKAAPKTKATLSFPHSYLLTDNKIGHWATVVKYVNVHSKPSMASHVITSLDNVTGDGTQNLVLILDGLDLNQHQTWYHIRLPILPNNTTGWVPRSALGDVYTVHTHVYVNRETHTLTLKRDGHVIFTTPVGVGRPSLPTPAGQYYIRDMLKGFNNPVYGPLAFGTSAKSVQLEGSWPGGAFVGIHGTNEDNLIPGNPSHGCIRVHNYAILRLAKLMKVGSPLTIT